MTKAKPNKSHNRNKKSPPKPIHITLYKWEGRWGPIGATIPCGECTITDNIIEDVLQSDLKNINIKRESFPFFEHWWKPLMKGGWHPPIVMVAGKVISQGVALNRGLLIEHVMKHATKRYNIKGNVIFSKDHCSYCTKAKALLDKHAIRYETKNVITSMRDLYDLMFRIKDIIGEKTPVTTPQIWLDGRYIGGYEALKKHLEGK